MKKIVLFDIDDVLFKTADFINSGFKRYESYEDAKGAIEEVKELADVAILSRGEYNLQLNKLKKTELLGFFCEDDIFIVKEKAEEVKSVFAKLKDKLIFIVEDRLDNLEKIKKINPKVKTVFIKRGRYKDSKSDFRADYVINGLNQILKILC